MEDLEIQFQLLRLAHSSLSNKSFQGFFKKLAASQAQEKKREWEEFKLLIGDMPQGRLSESIDRAAREEQKQIRMRFGKSNQYFFKQFVIDGLCRSQLLLAVAHFESFLKDIHEGILWCRPSILALRNTNRHITREDLFTKGYEKVLETEICREIDDVDRMPVKKRATYFTETLALSWGDEDLIKEIGAASDVRNEISHENPDKVISEEFVSGAILAIKKVVKTCIFAATRSHPMQFKLS